ncbi:MAG TPA: cytochrome c family protein [Candidatus Krumholzibacteria bacterium]|nr:cytochrome c family protein [Candidatus Krumholzibacteria bacterium]
MRRSGGASITLLIAGACLLAYSVVAGAAEHKFVGTAKCAVCHKTATAGEQYPKWQASKHSKAYEALASPKALEIAKAKGIADPQKSMDCLKCHVTAAGVDTSMVGVKYSIKDGVGCESCHGAGADYIKKSTMEGLISGTIEKASVGLNMPDQATCEKCHNKESPTFTGFDFAKAKAAIAHPIPEERKAKYKSGG